MDAEPAARRRVFFALWPGDETQSQLHEYGALAHKHHGGRRMRRETLHLTLAFIGGIPGRRVAELEILARSIRVPAFELTLDRLECLPRRKIVWIGAGEVPAALEELAGALEARLGAAGFRTEERPFAAHVTVLRNARCDGRQAEAPPHIVWRVGEFALVESELKPEGARYRILARWPLKSGNRRGTEGAEESPQ